MQEKAITDTTEENNSLSRAEQAELGANMGTPGHTRARPSTLFHSQHTQTHPNTLGHTLADSDTPGHTPAHPGTLLHTHALPGEARARDSSGSSAALGDEC